MKYGRFIVSLYMVYRNLYDQYKCGSGLVDREKAMYYRNIANMIADNYNHYISNVGFEDEYVIELDTLE